MIFDFEQSTAWMPRDKGTVTVDVDGEEQTFDVELIEFVGSVDTPCGATLTIRTIPAEEAY